MFLVPEKTTQRRVWNSIRIARQAVVSRASRCRSSLERCQDSLALVPLLASSTSIQLSAPIDFGFKLHLPSIIIVHRRVCCIWKVAPSCSAYGSELCVFFFQRFRSMHCFNMPFSLFCAGYPDPISPMIFRCISRLDNKVSPANSTGHGVRSHAACSAGQ